MRARARTFATVGRVALILSVLALAAAWVSSVSASQTWLGLAPSHWFADAIVMALLGIAGLLDALVHQQEGD